MGSAIAISLIASEGTTVGGAQAITGTHIVTIRVLRLIGSGEVGTMGKGCFCGGSISIALGDG